MAIYLIVLMSTLFNTALGGSRVAMSLLAIDLGANPFGVGLLAALYGVFPMLLAIYAGKLIDRVGARGPMIAGVRVTVNHITHITIPLLFGAMGSVLGVAPVFISNGLMLLTGGIINQRAARH